VIALLFGARWWLDRQWYVGPADGSVAIFQGMPLTILGYDLGHPVEVHTDLPASEVRELEAYDGFDEGIPVADREKALALVEDMEEDLRVARAAQQDAGGGGNP
jgi:protein phosphatase